jgi:hypothetical protein
VEGTTNIPVRTRLPMSSEDVSGIVESCFAGAWERSAARSRDANRSLDLVLDRLIEDFNMG